ncbi:hypothetical protein HBI24_031810 [Parastagonospora nodorum]|uniref:Uncharacterized protein n=1 Tax=Phaeosphaeria nodorum (strain SN15 / ATCC MYA-4574 / FGSC 10173) TaxID=321614 RepID=A0A7U2ERB0_PHANO|nr:hypothetical protein HBH53_168640 [Parastagonospora nodorum]QRC91631.1 hypothetical protein JI435_401470 [Parastagonospora nodorum SN15]KAH4051612.1 hypothetical protein HBH49_120160 [Parastagonospora nodorum]KAH4140579.1 hypothetical protein HBH45_080600 [Parastagonospora nodorum]KAH4168071.1 hypothetical protein HBH44_056450 [Parastagonospora nodorum]
MRTSITSDTNLERYCSCARLEEDHFGRQDTDRRPRSTRRYDPAPNRDTIRSSPLPHCEPTGCVTTYKSCVRVL